MNFSLLYRMIMRRLMGKAINRGIDYASRKGKNPATMTSAERAKARKTSAMAKRAHKMAKIAKRLR